MILRNNKERVFVAIDVMNIFHSGQDQFGRDYRVNFKKLLELINKASLSEYGRDLIIVAYTVTPHFKVQEDGSIIPVEVKNNRFLGFLKHLEMEVKNRDTFVEKGVAKPVATDWDVGITLDAVNRTGEYDTFCLVSGDGDFSLLVDDLKNKGKYTEIITFEKSASRVLCASAHKTTYITEKEMMVREQDHGRASY